MMKSSNNRSVPGGCDRKRDGDSAFDLLPQKVREELLEKRRKEEDRVIKYQVRLKKKAIKGSVIGAAVALGLCFFMGEPTVVFIIILGLFAAGSAYLIVKRKLGHLASISLYGGGAIVASIVGFRLGLLSPYAYLMFFIWIFYLVAGLLIGIWATEPEISSDLD